MGDNYCVKCGGKYYKQNKICGKCGNVKEVQRRTPSSIYKFDEGKGLLVTPDDLIKKIEKSLKTQSLIRSKIVSKKQKLKQLINVKADNSGHITIKVNNELVKATEAQVRILIQTDINLLINELQDDLIALEEFNSKFE